ncbi:hypothetical protein [Rhizosphaericola mali]|uniref:Uncharacterized protein n=1 Tax=Rhizosphaericola mali TaxID=2545455 RepID=A0A5P2G6D5_9BACT|nr:hypothetical protein [Rhizosphaericola mali]QES88063.1 hypothetical protein E0W69_005085 [Rhizosphaericola mali]QES88783.1 hypothetical protein E0W69_009000 [Rhizosphaericola mali]
MVRKNLLITSIILLSLSLYGFNRINYNVNIKFNSSIRTNKELKDSTKQFKNIRDFIVSQNFNGVVVFRGKVLSPNDSLLYIDLKASGINPSSVDFLRKVPSDSLLKYGLEAKKGLLIIN